MGMETKVRRSSLSAWRNANADPWPPRADMAEFTGAQETIPLGKKANKEAAERMRSGMVDMIHDAEEDEDDEEAREWEMAQIKRGEQRRDTGSNVRTLLWPLGEGRKADSCEAGGVEQAGVQASSKYEPPPFARTAFES